MTIIEIAALENGAHRNQTGTFATIPDGWAVVPESVEIPDTFPFVIPAVEGQVVTALLPGVVPDPASDPEPEPTQLDRLEAQIAYTALMTDTLIESEE